MTAIAAGNTINFGSPINRQGTLIGPLRYINMLGYVDIPDTNVAGPLPWVVKNPSRYRADLSGIVLPNPHRLTAVGIKVPATNLQGKEATLIGTNGATFRNGFGASDAGGAIVTLSGTTQGAIEVMVPTPFPASVTSANTYQFYTSANIRSSLGTMRIYGYVQYAIPSLFPNIEELVTHDAPTVVY